MALGSTVAGWMNNAASGVNQAIQQRQAQVTGGAAGGGNSSAGWSGGDPNITYAPGVPMPGRDPVVPPTVQTTPPSIARSTQISTPQSAARNQSSDIAGYEQANQRGSIRGIIDQIQNQVRAPIQSVVDYTNLQYGPQVAQWQLNQHQLQQNAGFDAQSLGLQRGDLQHQYAQGNQALGLNNAGLGLDREDLGLDRRGNDVSRGYIGQMQGIADRALANTVGGYERDARIDQRDTTSDYTARGAFFAPFHSQDLDNIASRRDERITGVRLDRESSEAGWQRDLANLGLSDERIGIAERRLDLEAQRFGMERADLEHALNSGLAKLGLQGQINASQLAYMMDSGNAELAALGNEMLQFAMSADPTMVHAIMSGQANMLGGG